MAQRRVVQFVDDFDGKELDPGDCETVRISLDGVHYEMDLSEKNARRLRHDFDKWLSHARRSTGRRVRTPASAGISRGYDPRAVRKWAESNNVAVPARGRIPADVIERYRSAGN